MRGTVLGRTRPLAARSRTAGEPRKPGRPWQVAATAAVAYALIVGMQAALVGLGAFTQVGSFFAARPRSGPAYSAAIARLPSRTVIGYDGQFSYYIALDPLRARYYVDDAPYRYGRILYPLSAWLVAFGQPGALPYTLIAVNLFAVLGTVWLLARFLRRHALSAWWAAVYGFFPPLVLCVLRDLTEPLALFLVALGFVLLERRPERALRYAPLFALAALARETTVVFPALLSLAVAFGGFAPRRPSLASLARAAGFAALSLAPVLAYRLVLRWWLHGWPQQRALEAVPFGGLGGYWPFDADHLFILLTVALPGLAWLALALAAAVRARAPLPLALPIANVLLFVVLLPGSAYVDYSSAGRATAAIVLCAILALPTLRALPRPTGALAFAALLLWTPAWAAFSLLASGI